MSSRIRAACIALALVAGLTGTAQAATCRVPRAVLCKGCAERVVIRLEPGGVCRVSFTPMTATGGAEAEGFVEVDIIAGARGAKRRTAEARPRHRGPYHRSGNRAGGCFQFNGRQFCE